MSQRQVTVTFLVDAAAKQKRVERLLAKLERLIADVAVAADDDSLVDITIEAPRS